MKGEMMTTVECPSCGRVTGTKHNKCIYCGEILPSTGHEEKRDYSEIVDENAKSYELLNAIPDEIKKTLPPSFLKKFEKKVVEKTGKIEPKHPNKEQEVIKEKEGDIAFPTIRRETIKGKRYHLVLISGHATNRDNRSFAEIMNMDLYTANQILLRRFPSIIRSGDTYEELKEISDRLNIAKFDSCIISEKDFEELSAPFYAISCNIRNIDFVFKDMKGEEESIIPHEIEVMVSGIIRTERLELKKKTPLIKMWGRSEKGRSEKINLKRDRFFTGDDFKILDIYTTRKRRAIRITSNLFNFACLGNDKTYSSFINIEKFVELFLSIRPDSPVDRNFRLIPPLMVPLEQFLPEETLKKGGSRFEYRTNFPQFCEYSAMIYLIHHHRRFFEGGRG